MNRGQWLAVTVGGFLVLLSGLVPPFAEVRSSGGVFSGTGPRGRGEERVTRDARGHDWVWRWTGDGTDLGGGLYRYAPDFRRLGLQWLAIIAAAGGLACALRDPSGRRHPAEPGGAPDTGRPIS